MNRASEYIMFKCPRCRRMHSVPNKTDLKDFICPADVFVQANKPKQQDQLQKFSSLSNPDGTIRTCASIPLPWK